jgi:hypothetical protein
LIDFNNSSRNTVTKTELDSFNKSKIGRTADKVWSVTITLRVAEHAKIVSEITTKKNFNNVGPVCGSACTYEEHTTVNWMSCRFLESIHCLIHPHVCAGGDSIKVHL